MLKQLFCLISVLLAFLVNAQTGFQFDKASRKHIKIPFKRVGNLMVLKVKLNEVPLSFILDTGANHTFLFNLVDTDSLELKNIKKIKVNGLGSSESVESIKSSNNTLQINGITNKNQDIHLILDQEINFSSQLGVPIHGIIGCDFFENFIVKINYSTQSISLYKPTEYKDKKNKKYEALDLRIHKKRMYANAFVGIDAIDNLIPVALLLDTGSSDSVWLFENKQKNIKVPVNRFRDYMGTGIGGTIYGDRSRLKKLKFSNFELLETKVSFPDSLDVALAFNIKNRQGSIGSEILKRFHIVFDYARKKMYLKKNRFYKQPFEYNMSGIEIEHNGLRVERVFDGKIQFSDKENSVNNARTAYSLNSLYKTSLVPVFEVVEVREGSPAYKAGIQIGDILTRVNKKYTYRHKLSEIIEMLSEEEGKNVNLEVERNGKKMTFHFILKRLL